MRGGVSSKRGMALVITLLLTAFLVIVITEIVRTVQMNAATAALSGDLDRSSQAARGGLELARALLKETAGGKDYTWFQEGELKRVFSDGEKTLSLLVEDEHSRLNPNGIVYPNGEVNAQAFSSFSRLLEVLGLGTALAEPLADWIDADDVPRARGAETADAYRPLKPPYAAKNGKVESLGELRLVKGYTSDIFNRLSPFVTVHTDGRVNINSAPVEVLMSLSAEITREMAERIVEYRKKTPFRHASDIRKVSGLDTIGFALQGRITVKSGIFRVFSRASSGGGVREVEAVVSLEGDRVLYLRER